MFPLDLFHSKFHNYVRNIDLFLIFKDNAGSKQEDGSTKTLQTMQNFKRKMKMEMTEEMSKCNHL